MRGLEDLIGTWRLRRRIFDRRAGEIARMVGAAHFRPGAEGAVQEETGTLRLPGRSPLTATRTYMWSEAPGRLVVRFADGRAFHAFDPRATDPEAEHSCAEDLYRVRYDFRRWPRWRSDWCVSGPRKNLVIVSAFAPLAPDRATRQNPTEVRKERTGWPTGFLSRYWAPRRGPR